MPGITHSWNGTVLTISSDSGTSSVDLKGDMGPRGPQGPAGISIGEGGDIDLSNYATKTYVQKEIDNALEDFEPSGSDVDLTDYYTKTEVDAKIPDVSNLATKQEVTTATSGLATETFVTNKIAEAQLSGGEGGDIDLSGYRTMDNNEFTNTLTITNADGTMHIYSNGIQGADSSLWIGGDGEGCFTDLKIGTVGNYKPVATQEYVTAAINDALAALDGDEEEY